MGGFFSIVKYIGGAYLIWIGYSLLTSTHKTTITIKEANSAGNLSTSFLASFFLTLGDVKAILFMLVYSQPLSI